MNLIRQGDVLIRPIDKTKGKKVADNKYTLAFGETTGHHHDIIGDVKIFKQEGEHKGTLVGEGNGLLCIEVGEQGATLTHQEHDHLEIPAGTYEVVMQREYDVVEGIRQVLD